MEQSHIAASNTAFTFLEGGINDLFCEVYCQNIKAVKNISISYQIMVLSITA